MKPSEIDKVYCLFEQSGTFKNVLRNNFNIKKVFDFDLKDDFGETDVIIDLFKEIENEFNNLVSHTYTHTIFSELTKKSLCFAFFPCIYFSALKGPMFDLTSFNFRKKNETQIAMSVCEQIKQRALFHEKIYQLYFSKSKGYG